MLNFKNLIHEFKQRFPLVEITDEIEGLPIVIFGLWADNIVSAIKGFDYVKQQASSDFINEMAESEDNVVISSLSEVVAVLYDNLTSKQYQDFMLGLTEKSRDRFKINVEMWKGNFPQ